MSTTQTLVTNLNRLQNANNFVQSFANNSYYLYTAYQTNYSTNTIPTIYDDSFMTSYDPYRNMEFGKSITSNSIIYGIRNIAYVANTVYSMYDDKNIFLSNSNYYAIVNTGSTFYVYKCLYNNNGMPSTVQPTYYQTSQGNNYYQTADGYIWKYMYQVPAVTANNFGSAAYFPYQDDFQVINNARIGTVDVIQVQFGGVGYNNYTQGAFAAADIALGGNTLVYNLSNNQVSKIQSFYEGCYLYITSGTGAGQYRKISNYYINSTASYVVLQSPFNTQPQNGSTFTINPAVIITGDGSETNTAIAVAVINSVANSVSYVQIYNNGANYKYYSASVYANPTVLVQQQANVRIIIPPSGGHGSNPLGELGCNTVIISTKLSNNEFGTIPITNQYRQIGILLNPTFSNIAVVFKSQFGNFVAGEPVYTLLRTQQFAGLASMSLGNTFVSITGVDATTLFQANDYIYVQDTTQTFNQFLVVNSVINSSSFTITTNALFTSASVNVFEPTFDYVGKVGSFSTGSIVLNGSPGNISSNSLLIGDYSGAIGTVNTYTFNSKTKSFNTFIGMHFYNVTNISGNFQQNEIVYQFTLGTANGIFHSLSNNVLYVANQVGIFSTNTNIVGANSGATATVTATYSPDIDFDSGQVLYLENFDPITRSNTQSETFNITVTF